MKKIKVIFMGTPDFALPALRMLNENFEVSLVVTQPDKINKRGNKIIFSPVKQFALDNNIEVFQPENINELESVDKLKSYFPDYIVVVAYGQIIKKEVREIPKRNIVNIHASLLPKYRGAAPIHRAIMDREEFTGVSIMQVGPGLDKGEIYLTEKIEIGNKKLPEVHDELSKVGGHLLLEYINLDINENIYGVIQDDTMATYAHKIEKEDGYLDFENIEREIGKINGLFPRPGASMNYLGERVKVLDALIFSDKNDEKYEISEIISVDDKGILVNCKDGMLLLTEIQFPGKKAMKVSEYLKGNSIKKTKLR